jgi:ketosteroid isomerase-like protein
MRPLYLVLPLLGVLIASGCSSPPFDEPAEARKLLQRDAEWAQAAYDGKDIDKIVSNWSARVIEPGQPVYEGKAAIRAYVIASLNTPGFKIHWVSEKPVFSPDGKMAYMPGVDEMTVPGPSGAIMTVHMRGISIWRRDSDGEWRCVVDIANESPPA